MTYEVTVTPKYPDRIRRQFTMTVEASSKSEAIKRARSELERDGHYFKGDDAVTFMAVAEGTP